MNAKELRGLQARHSRAQFRFSYRSTRGISVCQGTCDTLELYVVAEWFALSNVGRDYRRNSIRNAAAQSIGCSRVGESLEREREWEEEAFFSHLHSRVHPVSGVLSSAFYRCQISRSHWNDLSVSLPPPLLLPPPPKNNSCSLPLVFIARTLSTGVVPPPESRE